MQIFRSFNPALKGLPKRQSWHNLSAYTLNNQDLNTWKDLRSKDITVQLAIDRYNKPSPQDTIDWSKWQKSINHKDIVNCLKTFYEDQIQLLDNLSQENHNQFINKHTKGWNLYEEALVSCEKSVEKSESLVSNGARALWVSYNNPPIWKIDTNEWVESDQYWQAYIEKHHFYNPNPTSNDPELPNEIETIKKSWHTKMATFNDRTDTAMLYCYMEHLPSWEYYDLHRRAFLEHMTYFLIRTGGDYQFFPECPPWQWLTDIEELRYRFISITQRRRSQFQLQNLEKMRPLDLQPSDYEHDGEAFHMQLIFQESRVFEMMVGRLMGNFLFLTHPFIPFQNYTGFSYALNSDQGKGTVYSIGEDVNALFYLPTEYSLNSCSPKAGLNTFMDHLTLTGRKLNPGYASLYDIFTDLLGKRGTQWFNVSNETVADAFFRKIRNDDPSFSIYEAYISELKQRFSNLTEINDPQEIYKKITEMEDLLDRENKVYEQITFAFNSDLNTEMQMQRETLQELFDSQNLSSLTSTGSISDSFDNQTEPHSIINSFHNQEEEQSQVMEYIKSIKLGNLEKMVSKDSK